MRKQIKKTKITKRKKKKQQKYLGEVIYFEVILMVILIPTTVLFLVPIFQKPLFKDMHRQPHKIVYEIDNENSVEITTEKMVYRHGDKATLFIKNNSNNSIYFEPCEYLDNFEKKVNGVWINGRGVVKNKIYDSSNFRKGKSVTSCNINLSKLGVGTYRTVVKVYYNCQMPGGDMCSRSKTFYSNEFKVVGR